MGQNVHDKFTDAQNEIRIAIMNFIIDNKRQFNLESDGFSALENINLSNNEDYPGIVTEKEFDDYAAKMGLEPDKIIKAGIQLAIREAKGIFERNNR